MQKKSPVIFLDYLQYPYAKVRNFVCLLSLCFIFTSCQKNNVSSVPFISPLYFGIDYGRGADTPVICKISTDTVFLEFSITDGDGDLGNDTTKHLYDIYIKDYRFDTGYVGYAFPPFDQSIENPKYGLTGTCFFLFFAPYLSLRVDTLPDTTHFEMYVMDKAGHKSNHIITPRLIMIP